MTDLNDVLASRYEVDIEQAEHGWRGNVWLITKTTRQHLFSVAAPQEQAAREATYQFLMDRPR